MAKETFEAMYERFREALVIDRNSLDEACENHAQLYMEVQEAYILAASLRDEGKTAMEEVSARVASKIRTGFEKSGDKYTEGSIKEQVAVDEEYLESVALYQERHKEAALLGGLVAAYDQRQRMLSKLADLYQSGYFVLSGTRGSASRVQDADAERARKMLGDHRDQKRPKFGRR